MLQGLILDDERQAFAHVTIPDTGVLGLSRSELGSVAQLPRALARFGSPSLAQINTLSLSYNCLTDISPITGKVLPNLQGELGVNVGCFLLEAN